MFGEVGLLFRGPMLLGLELLVFDTPNGVFCCCYNGLLFWPL